MKSSENALDARGRLLLATAIGETPETVMDVHRLRRGLCHAIVAGAPERPRAAIVQPHDLPTEPTAYGDDPALIWALLRELTGWSCVNTTLEMGTPLARLIEAGTGQFCQLYGEIYYALERPVALWPHAAVRRLTLADVPLMEAATRALNMDGWRYGSAAALIADGFAAGAVVDGELVTVAFTAARGDRYADVGIVTREDWRLRGLSTAAAALVCSDVQQAGQTPVWSTGWDNVASQRVAAKLGFAEVSGRVYVCLD
jgi:RimJ/RimL family protein N-acetyltransferase